MWFVFTPSFLSNSLGRNILLQITECINRGWFYVTSISSIGLVCRIGMIVKNNQEYSLSILSLELRGKYKKIEIEVREGSMMPWMSAMVSKQ